MGEKAITMQDPLLKPAEMELEAILGLLIRKMITGGYESGKASLALNIDFMDTEILDENGEVTNGITPHIKYKCTYGVKETIGVSGSVLDDKKVIAQNNDGTFYFREAEKAQKSMF